MINKSETEEIEKYKRSINETENKIDFEKRRIKDIENLQEEVVSLNKNLDECIKILEKSMQGPTTNYAFEDMHNNNRTFFVKTTSVLDEQIKNSQKKINSLSEKKEEQIKTNNN